MAKRPFGKVSSKIILLLLAGVIALALTFSCASPDTQETGEATPTASVAATLPGTEPFPGPDLAQDMTAGYEMFLYLDGLNGESIDEQHEGWIDVLAYSHSISQPSASSISAGSSRIAGRSEHQSFTVVKQLDKASPKLALYCCSGTHIPEVILELCYATGDRLRFMEYTLSDVMVYSVSPSGSVESGEARPIEEVSFSYGSIEWNYTEMDPDTGKAKGNVEAHWDLTTNTGG
jgi:type VI secretion system secreted protein Hcp